MNELQIFENPEFGQLRKVTIDGEPWFVGKDVVTALGYKDAINALKDHVDECDKRGWQIATQKGVRDTTIINESGLYALIFNSKLERAKQFKHWVTSEVLPQIRKTGNYLAEADTRLSVFIESQQQFIERQEKFNQMLMDKLESLNSIQTRQTENDAAESVSVFVEEDEFQRRRRVLNQLVDEMAKVCIWDRSLALHRLYKALEKALNISLDEYTEIYQVETGNVHASTWKVVTESNRLYKTAVQMCTNTINNMKC